MTNEQAYLAGAVVLAAAGLYVWSEREKARAAQSVAPAAIPPDVAIPGTTIPALAPVVAGPKLAPAEAPLPVRTQATTGVMNPTLAAVLKARPHAVPVALDPDAGSHFKAVAAKLGKKMGPL